jgi:succinate dehydrogenase/fumarate reductase flavoprotein subunit
MAEEREPTSRKRTSADRRGQRQLDYDVVVAGYGYSGAMTAIAAADAGAKVALFEKMPRPGGNSIVSGGACVIGTNYEETLAYLRHTCQDATDDDVLVAFAAGMVGLPQLIEPLARSAGFQLAYKDRGEGAYPFPGAKQLRAVRVTRNEAFRGFDFVTGGRAGATLFAMLSENVRSRSGIDVYLSSRIDRLARKGGEVVGCLVTIDGQGYEVAARRAVVLCTGGFEHNRQLQRHYLGTADLISASPLSSTGDGILMGQEAGAALWHMWHVHGSYGFRLPDIQLGIRHAIMGARDSLRPMPWIVVDGQGHRFMNEYPNAPQDTPIRDLLYFDVDRQIYPRIPSIMLLDEEGLRMGPIGRPVMSDPALAYEWSADNLREVASGYIKEADSLAGLAKLVGVEPRVLSETVGRWNEFCRAGVDSDFNRPGWSMRPIRVEPFYAVPVFPVITNTQGGLVHDSRQRALDPYGAPIRRLYKAGEMGSIFGHLYLLGGNNTECLVGGWIAGTNAAHEPDTRAQRGRERLERRCVPSCRTPPPS